MWSMNKVIHLTIILILFCLVIALLKMFFPYQKMLYGLWFP